MAGSSTLRASSSSGPANVSRVRLNAVGGAGGVAERGEGVLDDFLGQFARGVMRARGATVTDLGDDQRAGREDGGQAAEVPAQEPAQRPDPGGEFSVVVARRVQRRLVID